jgi:hypothetical protein
MLQKSTILNFVSGFALIAFFLFHAGSVAGQSNGGAEHPDTTSTAKLQIIHNSADAVMAEVDVYLDNTLLLSNIAFRTASSFLTVAADIPKLITVTSAGAGINQPLAAFNVYFEANKTYIAVANGIVSATGYSPSPPFLPSVFDQGRELAQTAGNTDILVIHGSTDAPVVDIKVGTTTLVDNLGYGMFDGYLEIPTADLVIDVTDQSGTNVLVQYHAPLTSFGLQDSAITVVASGFLDPTNNSNSTNTFGLWVALPAGGALIPLSIFTSVGDTPTSLVDVSVYPNPAVSRLNYSLPSPAEETLHTELIDMSGRILHSRIADGHGQHHGEIDVSHMQSGIYLLRFTSGTMQHSERVVIQR